MADLITILKLKTSLFDKALRESGGQLNDFKKKGEGANAALGGFKKSGTSAVAMLGKYVKVAAIAKFAFDQFSMAVKRNQQFATTLSTAWSVTKLRVNDFFIAITTGNWSKLRKGFREAIADANELAESARTAALAIRTLQAELEGAEAVRENAEADTKNDTLTEEEIKNASKTYQGASDDKIKKLKQEKQGNDKEILDEFKKAGFVPGKGAGVDALLYYTKHYIASNKNYDSKKAELDQYNKDIKALKLAHRRLHWGKTKEYLSTKELREREKAVEKADKTVAKYSAKQKKEFDTANKLIKASAIGEEEVKDNPDKINVGKVLDLYTRNQQIGTNIGTIRREKKDNLDDLENTLKTKKENERLKKELREGFLAGGGAGGAGDDLETKEQKYVRFVKHKIDLMNIEKGEEAKYTEEGKAMYEEYFDNKLALYTKDSKEYQEVVLEKARYEKGLSDKVLEEKKKLAEMAAKIKPHSFLLDIGIDNRSVDELELEIQDLTQRINASKNAEVRIKLIAEREELIDIKNKRESGGDVGEPERPNFTPVDVDLSTLNKKYIDDGGYTKHLKGTLKTAKTFNNLARAIRGVGDAMAATGNDSKAMARSLAMVSAAASIAMMISIMVEKSKESLTIWDWIAGITAGTATVVAMAAQLRSINTSKFAEGGIVPGNNTIGDMNIVRVNSGEMILNTRQLRNLFNLLNGNGSSTGSSSSQVEFKIRGKELVGVLDNYNNKVNRVR